MIGIEWRGTSYFSILLKSRWDGKRYRLHPAGSYRSWNTWQRFEGEWPKWVVQNYTLRFTREYMANRSNKWRRENAHG